MPKIINSDEKRLEICTLAYERFIEEGVAEFSLNKFIEYLNMSKGQFYYYFKSKEKLIFETLKIKELEFTKIIKQIIRQKIIKIVYIAMPPFKNINDYSMEMKISKRYYK